MGNIFKVGDKVYHPWRGWGTIQSFGSNLVNPQVSFKNDKNTHTHCEVRLLSFTEYNFEKGGFSQDRDLALIGKWCRVWDTIRPDCIKIAKLTGIYNDLEYPYQAGGDGWRNAELISEDLLKTLIKEGLISDGNDTRDNSNS